MKSKTPLALPLPERHRMGIFLTPAEREFLRVARFQTGESYNTLVRRGLKCLAIQLGIQLKEERP